MVLSAATLFRDNDPEQTVGTIQHYQHNSGILLPVFTSFVQMAIKRIKQAMSSGLLAMARLASGRPYRTFKGVLRGVMAEVKAAEAPTDATG